MKKLVWCVLFFFCFDAALFALSIFDNKDSNSQAKRDGLKPAGGKVGELAGKEAIKNLNSPFIQTEEELVNAIDIVRCFKIGAAH